MKLCSYILNGKFLEQQKRSAKIYAEKEFLDEQDDAYTFRRRILILSGDDEWGPRDPRCRSPSNEGDISGEMGADFRYISNGKMVSPIRPRTYRALRASQCSAGHRLQQRRPCV